jgi:hypothetical protein
MVEEPEKANASFRKAIDILLGIKQQPATTAPAVPDYSTIVDAISGASTVWQVPESTSKAIDSVAAALKTEPASQWAGIPGVMQSIGDNAGTAAGKVQTLADNLGKIPGATSGATTFPPSHAAGIKRVPFDNYPALLHKGETVLPSGEAGEYRGNGNRAGKAGSNINLTIHVNGANMDENRLASILVNRLREVALNMA